MRPRRGVLGGSVRTVAAAAALALAASAHAADYTVRRGDTLSEIAAAHGVSLSDLAAANGIRDPDRIRAGQRLSIPGRAPAFSLPQPATHRIAPGETLARIAARHRTAIWPLVAANRLADPNRILAGATLAVPRWICPVPRRVSFVDTWGAPRRGGRRHEGTDVFAQRGTPVVASVSGLVEQVRGPRGGLQFRLWGDDGHLYVGTHMAAFGHAGRVPAGAVVGYVGTTGNAAGTDPHLHFEILPGGDAPVNPFPALAATCTR